MMNNSFDKRIIFKLTLTVILTFFGLQSIANAQTEVNQQESNNINNTQPNSTLSINYPQAQPDLPRKSIRRKRLLIRSVSPVPLTIPDTTEENIHLLLVLKERRLYVYRGDILQASYPVAIGQPQWETPVGKFKVLNMIENPAWENPFVENKQIIPPGSQNPLGERWIGFWSDGKDEIGFHGTYQRDSIGKAVSHGCVRLYNEDVLKLYEIVKVGTPVIVVP
ncbi:L,D-transpeptidase [Sphaerospermopsis kisseleviana CS-549]|uniref:L,D-transpeptidase n=1 Tax=Sphaerospermopsis kisseleviana CS-549 TaxID=3021783 RepID=A0ABT4ZWZ5_9CYAN|nr:L,D-transpeptidase [Sphaerospermopsis kisseleviana]MDB9443960.1 L,D-transpeptidase [Sphaerospermopsis kisseleviana CS-549]BAZ82104.1 ErfK/YbiS/YcfS/YnhG family protein [Sphaerospermopsis kisseleviana NIES-73]